MLIEFFTDGRLELYNLAEDIAKNVSGCGASALVNHMHEMLKRGVSVSAKIPISIRSMAGRLGAAMWRRF